MKQLITERFWAKVKKTPDCWEWQASLDGKGYGQFGLNGRTRKAHQVAYELLVGLVPQGLELDHLCRNSKCVRPEHLEAVTHRTNLLRGAGLPAQYSRAITCPNGHPWDIFNTYFISGGGRKCRECDLIRHRRIRTVRIMADQT